MDGILFWVVQPQGQWRSISTELYPDRHRGWPPHPSQRSGGCSTIIEEREVSWSRQQPNRTGPSRWRGCNHRSHDNLRQALADRRMANPMDPVLRHHTSQERQPAAVPELPNNKPHQSPKQSHAEGHWLNILKPQAGKIIAEEQAGFRARRSTTEQIFNLRILCEKSPQHHQDLYHVFINFKKAFDRVWHAALLATMKKYNISTNLIQVIKNL